MGNDGLFAFVRTIGLAAFTAACFSLHSLACAPELEHDVSLFALGDGPLELAEHHPARIVFHQVRFFDGHQFKAVPLQFSNNALLDIQAPCKPVQSLDEN